MLQCEKKINNINKLFNEKSLLLDSMLEELDKIINIMKEKNLLDKKYINNISMNINEYNHIDNIIICNNSKVYDFNPVKYHENMSKIIDKIDYDFNRKMIIFDEKFIFLENSCKQIITTSSKNKNIQEICSNFINNYNGNFDERILIIKNFFKDISNY